MKATIQSTTATVNLDKSGTIKARVWEGVTEQGVPFVAYIPVVQVRADADNSAFERELAEHKTPERVTHRAIDLRMVI